MDSNAEQLRAMVRGRVQGVGFRAFVLARAASFGLTGYVRNTSDGNGVEIVAEGARPALKLLLAALREGPRMSRVDRVDASWDAAAGKFDGFEVR